MSKITAIPVLLALLLFPAPADARQEAVEATVAEFKGTVDVKKAGEKDWIPAEKEMKLKEGSEICTGFDSSAVLLFAGNTKVDVQSLSNIKIDAHAVTGKKATTAIGVQFGQIELNVKKSDLESDVKVSTPNSTTSISGTILTIRSFADEHPQGGGFDLPRGGGSAHASVRVEEGNVIVDSNEDDAGLFLGAGDATTYEFILPEDTEIVFDNTAIMPLVGALPEELGLSGDGNVVYDPLTSGSLGGELPPGTSPTGERIIQQESGLLPGPPPPPPIGQ